MLRNVNFYAPFKSINSRANIFPWFSIELLEGFIELDQLFAKARKSSDFFKAARRQRNVIKTKIEDARYVYYRDSIMKSKGDPRKYRGM